MENINVELIAWLHKIGVAPEHAQWVLQASEILLIVLLAYILFKICLRTVVPAISKVAQKTEFKWDDYLLNDNVLNKACHLVPPVVLSAMIPVVVPEDSEVLGLLMKICDIYFIVIVLRLVCAIINSLYNISNEHEKFKNRSMKGFYQMLKLVVICIGAIIIVAKLINESPVGMTRLGQSG
jgi:miniconductance mechanosensitive channel